MNKDDDDFGDFGDFQTTENITEPTNESEVSNDHVVNVVANNQVVLYLIL